MKITVKFVFIFLFLTGPVQAETGATFHVNLVPAGDFVGKAPQVKGQAVLTGATVKAQDIRVDLTNVTTGISLRDKHTKEKYLETGKYPEAILVRAEGQNGKGSGILKIKNKENPISGTYSISGNELSAQFKIKVSEYGITGIKYMGVGIDDEILIKISVPVLKK